MDSDTADTVLTLKGISKEFPGVKALDDVSFELKRGEVHGLVGENGAGKSTLMKILSGVYKADSGTILLDGNPLNAKTPHEAQDAGISIIFQEFSLIKTFDVTDNVFLNREPSNTLGTLNKAEARRRTEELLDTISFDLDIDTRISELSVVQRQIVEIIKALSVTAKVLIMDEPSTALTDKELKKLFEIITSLKGRGVTVIYISHMLEEIFEIADRVTVLKDGKVMGTRTREELSRKDLVRLMVGREIKEYFPDLSQTNRETILEVSKLSNESSIRDISFTLRRGEILGIAGMVGSGRNSLVRTLLGIEKATAGEILLHDEVISIHSIFDAIELGFGFITNDRKNHGILGSLSVKDNITIANLQHYLLYGFIQLRKEWKESAAQISLLNIKVAGFGQEMENLSGGNQQKVLISRWLLREPDIFVFSEPTRGIDIGAKTEIYRIMREVVDSGKAVIMISSELPEIIGMSDRILIMHSGLLAGEIDQHDHRATEEEIMSLAVGHEYSIHTGKGYS